MEIQELVNIALGLFSTIMGWMLKTLWDAVKDLQTADKQIINRISQIEVLVAGKYVSRSEMVHQFDKMSIKLDQIEKKIDAKVDKA